MIVTITDPRISAYNIVLDSNAANVVAPTGSSPGVMKLADVEGWYSSSFTTAVEPVGFGGDGGVAPIRSTRSPRTLTITGFAYGGTAANAVERCWMALNALGTGGDPLTVTVVDDFGTLNVTAYLAGGIQVEPMRNNAAKFQITLVCPDPRKYADPVITTGTAGATSPQAGSINLGTAPTYPIFIVTGPTDSAWYIAYLSGFVTGGAWPEYTEGRIDCTIALSSGQVMTITPFGGGRAYRGTSEDLSAYVDVSAWPMTPPRGNVTYRMTGAAGGATTNLAISTASAWW